MARPWTVSREERLEIYRLYHEEGIRINKLADKFHTSRATIHRVLQAFEKAGGQKREEYHEDRRQYNP